MCIIGKCSRCGIKFYLSECNNKKRECAIHLAKSLRNVPAIECPVCRLKQKNRDDDDDQSMTTSTTMSSMDLRD